MEESVPRKLSASEDVSWAGGRLHSVAEAKDRFQSISRAMKILKW